MLLFWSIVIVFVVILVYGGWRWLSSKTTTERPEKGFG
jgi:hypothetical protein